MNRTDPLEYLFGLERFGIKFGLENMRALVASLGHPERAFRSVHIAGTNGKGSVTAIVDSALRAAGFRSGRYTSPHLVDLSERFVVDGRPIDHEVLLATVSHVREHVEKLIAGGVLSAQPTFFEVTTAAALEFFAASGVDIAVIEVGLGGRLDATNVITPDATAITSIAFDHEKYLGQTLSSIASEKAGIIKPKVPVVIGALDPDAEAAIESIARERGATIVRANEGVALERLPAPPGAPTRIRLRTPTHDYGELTISLRGVHQIRNAVVAVRLLELLDTLEVRVPAAAIADGLASVSWPGRLEHRRVSVDREMILDAAHNPAGAAALAAYLGETFDEKLPLVFAAMRDKDVPRMFEVLLPAVSTVILTRASNRRSADLEDLAQQASAATSKTSVLIRPALADALATAWSLSPRIVVAGSIFLLGDVLREIETA
jgi:dihydrofolate synthase / folylpolyglutamate synthase